MSDAEIARLAKEVETQQTLAAGLHSQANQAKGRKEHSKAESLRNAAALAEAKAAAARKKLEKLRKKRK